MLRRNTPYIDAYYGSLLRNSSDRQFQTFDASQLIHNANDGAVGNALIGIENN